MKRNQNSERPSRNGKELHGAYIDTEPPEKPTKPTGPFTAAEETPEADLLIFVPRNEISRIIDDLTGRYGYSHLAIDCGEKDQPTGRRVMIEATMGPGVHYSFQDEYGQRAFVRIPLHKAGVDVRAFCECVHSKVGNKFDDVEAISLGILDNPARQICSDLATLCLSKEMQEEIARCHRQAVIHPLSAVREGGSGHGLRLFMSPNGYAEFFGAPRGRTLQGPDQPADPRIREARREPGVFEKLWKRGDTLWTSARREVRRKAERGN
ncbi:MAG: hypothetical protein ACM3QS_03275 [Bacteroidota bacterium]